MNAAAGATAPPTPATPAAATPATRAWFWALIGWTALLSFYHLGGGARFEPIDCWVAQTAREMLDADDWLMPRFSGETRMQKSPGPYWAVMVASLLRGTPVDEVSARLPNAVAGLVLVGTIFWLTRRIAGDRAAIFAGFAAASSALILWWSHRGASDLGLTACTTLSLAALWIAAESTPEGRNRNALFLLGYFAAGLGMLWKMPMPLVVVGLPAFLYVLLRWRWRVLRSRWHLVGLLVFLLPWLPWAIAVSFAEDAALLKWRVEFLDRFTGDLPNVEGQSQWKHLFTYLGPVAVYCLPFTLSLPAAFVRGFRRQAGVSRDGALFALIWFLSLLVFFTASAGKEWRYFLPALPPLFVLLGIELANLFDPGRPVRPGLVRAGVYAVWIAVPAGAIVGGLLGLRLWWKLRGQLELEGWREWSDVWRAYSVAAAILVIGLCLAAWLYRRRRTNFSFAAIVATVWLTWGWAWPRLTPLILSQRPFIDFAEQLSNPAFLPPGLRHQVRHVGTQDSRIVWYSDLRFPRLIDQLELLKEQDGRRKLAYEIRRYGEEMVNHLAGDQPVLLVAPLPVYVMFLKEAPAELAGSGLNLKSQISDRQMPPIHLWLQTRYGRPDAQFVMIGNRPPRHPEPELRIPDKWRQKIAEARARAASSVSSAPSVPGSVDATESLPGRE